jgi:predicted nuclease with TOPRIM domain
MSILSAQADALRDAAKRGGLVVGLPQMLDEAADTILELRDGLQQANAENTELREQLDYERQTSRSRLEGIDRFKAENAKLREACAELLKMAEPHDPEWLHWPEMYEELRKLGVDG